MAAVQVKNISNEPRTTVNFFCIFGHAVNGTAGMRNGLPICAVHRGKQGSFKLRRDLQNAKPAKGMSLSFC